MVPDQKSGPATNVEALQAASLLARSVHREQVWAALIRAVDFLLDDALTHLEQDLSRAQRAGDDEWTDRLMGRARMLKEIRREVTSPPPR